MINSILNYSFLQNALISGIILGFILPIIGFIVLLRKIPFIADALGHINMSAIAFVFFMDSLLMINDVNSLLLILIWSALGGILIEFISSNYEHYRSVAVMIVYSVAIAFTMIFLGLSNGFNDYFFNILFGNINTITDLEVWILGLVSLVVIVIFLVNYKKILIISIDNSNSKLYGVNFTLYRYLSIILISVVITLAIKVIGVLLVSSLILIPNLAAMRIGESLKRSLVIAIIFTEVCILMGIIISYYANLASSAIIVLFAVLVYAIVFLIQRV